MGRAPCCEKDKVKRGPWSPAEDQALILFIHKHGHSNWRALPKQAGLLRCGKSCRLRWMNYLRPDVKRGNLSKEEEDTIIALHHSLGNKWSQIASHLPGRTDNEIKNVWNTHLKKRLGKSDDKGRLDSSSSKTTGGKDALLHLQATTQQHQLDHTYQEPSSSSSSSSSSSNDHHHRHPAAADHDHQEVMNLEEADVELWNMLDALGNDDILIPDDHERDQQQFAAGNYSTDQCDEERLKWLHFIEHELGLDHDDDYNQLISTYPAAHTGTTSSTYLI